MKHKNLPKNFFEFFYLGKNEKESNVISVRTREGEKMDAISLDELVSKMKAELKAGFDK